MSGEGRYRIRAVSELVGVPAATLRAWERRYGVPSPARTPGSSYRLFSDEDVALLRRMRALVDGGIAPADAAAQLRREAAEAPEPTAERVDLFEAARRRIVDAVRAFDPHALERAVREAQMLGSARVVFTAVFAPALREIGDAWHEGEISVAQEHLASERLELAARDLMRLVQPDAPRRTALLACFAEERHVLPLLGAALDFVGWGYGVTLLGEGLPAEDLAHAVIQLHPDAVGLSITRTLPVDRAEALVRAYAGACSDTPWVVGGAGAEAIRPLVERAGGIVANGSPDAVRRTLDAHLAAREGARR
jgi:DNA-binding transcriptional MerR regulator